PTRLRERAAERGHQGLLRAGGEAPRPGRLGRHNQDQGRLRDSFHSAFLQVRATAAAQGDRGRHPLTGAADPVDARPGSAVNSSPPRLSGFLFAAAPRSWAPLRLKFTVTACQNGLWGEEPDRINDIAVVRVADFDRDSRRVRPKVPTYRAVEPAK